jgi:hypothetical protein
MYLYLDKLYTTGKRREAEHHFRNRWIFRFHTYISLDFRGNN